MKKITLLFALLISYSGYSQNSVSVATSQSWNAYVNAFNVSDSGYAFGFPYTFSDLKATATTSSLTLEPNTAIWSAEAANSAWFDQGASSQTALLYIEASSYIEDNSLADSDLTFTGNVSVSDLSSDYTPVAFIKALDPNSDYATVVNNNVSISTTGDFTISATASELASGYIIQYGFSVTGPLADPADTNLGSIVIEETSLSTKDNDLVNLSMYPNPTSSKLTISAPNTIKSAAIYNILGKQVMSLNINKNSESIDVSNLTSGMYLIKYNIDNAFGTAKFIKQ